MSNAVFSFSGLGLGFIDVCLLRTFSMGDEERYVARMWKICRTAHEMVRDRVRVPHLSLRVRTHHPLCLC